MNLAGLSSSIEANKKTLAIAGAAGVAGLALFKKKKTAGTPTAATSAQPVAASSAGSLASYGGAAAYDSTGSDVYNSLQPVLQSIQSDLAAQRSPDEVIPLPAAATQFSPSYTGTYVQYGKDGIFEQERDGSLYGLTSNEWSQALAKRDQNFSLQSLTGPTPTSYSTAANLAKKNGTATS